MKSPWICALRSVALTVPDLAAAETFYTCTWRLEVAGRGDDVLYLRGSGKDHHLLALHAAPGTPRLLKVTLRARSAAALAAIAAATPAAGGTVDQAPGAAADPAGGQCVVIRDADGRRIEIVHGDTQRAADEPAPHDMPVRLAHTVLNCHAIASTQTFFERALGFVLADRTKIMAFMNCDRDHHAIALGDTDNDALNHIAFLMPTLDAVMRGGGRLKDAGLPPQWGPGRHGPGANAFNYFVDPFGIVIEYTAEVEQIDDSYQPGNPSDWTWPPGRIDQWGIGTQSLHQRLLGFALRSHHVPQSADGTEHQQRPRVLADSAGGSDLPVVAGHRLVGCPGPVPRGLWREPRPLPQDACQPQSRRR